MPLVLTDAQALETWLTRFAAGAGTLLQWHLVLCGTYRRSRWALRASLRPEGGALCPISAQATIEGGTIFTAFEHSAAAEAQGLSERVHYTLVEAADDDVLHDAALRARLLRICRIEEKS